MPNKDGTGPSGKGPLTGRGMGPCEGNRIKMNFAGIGGGFGRGGRFGYRCFGRRFSRNGWFINDSNEKELLKNYRENLEKELEDVKKEEEKLK